MQNSTLVVIALAVLITWRMYRRIRRLVGRQAFRPWRIGFTLVLFPLFLAIVAIAASSRTEALEGLAAGAVLGVILGVVGLRLTRFEATPEGLFYTPNAHIGIALSLLFAARIVWRFVQMQGMGAQLGAHPPDFARSPLTLLVFGLLAGYYVAYAAGLLRWRASGPQPTAARELPTELPPT